MRKVKPEDEIPVRDLTDEAIQKRRNSDRTVSKQTIKRFKALDKYVQIKQDNDELVDIREIVPRIYKVADLIHKDLNDGRHVCRSGCAWCCQVPVTVTAVEAAYIMDRYGVEMNPLDKKTKRPESEEYCPLLDQETATCSVYEARPLSCRSFYTYDDPKYCVDPDTEHLIVSVNSHDALKHLTHMLHALSLSSPYEAIADIRDWVVKK